jgi:uncharacterized membrane protein YdfJ with MMPL/SSD domain
MRGWRGWAVWTVARDLCVWWIIVACAIILIVCLGDELDGDGS